MYDRLLKENPTVQQLLAQSEAKGALENAQRMLVTVVKVRFPALTELAKQKAAQINNPDILNYLVEQIAAETDETFVRGLLRPTPTA
jgi:hypothetical protein